MARQTFIWTTLPHGLAANQSLRLAVFLSPRLEAEAPEVALTDFPAWSAWTQAVKDVLPTLEFVLRYRRTIDHPPRTLAIVRPDPALTRQLWSEGWQALFAGAVVRPYGMTSVADRPIRSYKAAALDDDVRQRYARSSAIAVAQDQGAAAVAAPESQPATPGMREFLDFHERSSRPADAAPAAPAANPAAPREFHETLSWLGSFPELLGRLGLVFELTVPRDEFRLFDGQAQIQATPRNGVRAWPPLCQPGETCAVDVLHRSPWTIVDVASFWPAAGDPDQTAAGVRCGALVSGGLLCPRGDAAAAGSIHVAQIDLEGAALKLTSFQDGGADAAPTLPALRSAGFTFIRSNQADVMRAQASQAKANDATLRGGDPVLWAQNVNRGYRLDVYEQRDGAWRSLHQRDLAYGMPDQPARETITTEGFVQIATKTVADAAEGSELLLLESLARWTGWSLSVPRPLSVADPSLTNGAAAPLDSAPIAISQQAPANSLPRLRFGAVYHFRIRTVDLAGNGLSLEEATRATTDQLLAPAPSWASVAGRPNDHRYLRFEPIGSPVVVPRTRNVKRGLRQDASGATGDAAETGDALDRLLVRANGRDASPQAYVTQFPDYALANEVHLAPPRTSPAMAEAHSLFDAAFDSANADACDAAFALCQRDGDLPAFEPGPELALPYLPDPLARGVAVRLLGGLLEQRTLCRYRTDPAWPDRLPFRLVVDGANAFAAPAYDEAGRALTAGLPPGTHARVALSSFFLQDDAAAFARDLSGLGVWSWLDDLWERVKAGGGSGDITSRSALGRALAAIDDARWPRRSAGEGKFWFLTPPREITLVHALQQPYDPPAIRHLRAERAESQTFVDLPNGIAIHPESTGRLDLTAKWQETLDEPPALPRWLPPAPVGDAGQQRIVVRAMVRDQQILEPVNDGEHPYLWAEGVENPWWARKRTLSLTALGAIEGPGTGDARSVDAAGRRLPPTPMSDAPLRHAFGDTKHRWVDYRLLATSRFQDDFVPPAGADPSRWCVRESDPFRIDVLSSARPAPCVVQSVTPAFLRRTERSAGAVAKERWGGLRVYLERPWFGSGEDERLAVVLWDGADWPLPDDHPAAVLSTRWGRDPIWGRAPDALPLVLPSRPALDHFPLRVQDGPAASDRFTAPNGAALGRAFAVAAHAVRFNAERNLWFADVQVEPGDAYFPFIRLALGRFQPHSLDDLHLSEVVVSDFVQIPPRRRVEAAVVVDDPGQIQVTVLGSAVGTAAGPDGMPLPSSRVSVRVERRTRGADDLGWLPASLPAPIEIDADDRPAGVLWRGRLTLPPRRDNVEQRLLVGEDDFVAADGPVAGAFVAASRQAYSEAIDLDDLGAS